MLAVDLGQFLTPAEHIVLAELTTAAEQGFVCPLNLDLEMIIGCSSGSTVPKVIARLESKGFIRVRRYQRFREVQITATGQWTARSPSMHVERPHVPRGTHTAPRPEGGRIAKLARRM